MDDIRAPSPENAQSGEVDNGIDMESLFQHCRKNGVREKCCFNPWKRDRLACRVLCEDGDPVPASGEPLSQASDVKTAAPT